MSTTADVARANHPTTSWKNHTRGVLGTLLASCVALSAWGCSDESFTPNDCENVPLYNIRQASETNGAVKSAKQPGNAIVSNSPLSRAEQEALRRAEALGCITLPNFETSLDQPSSDDDE